jgi:hypothetical protein
MCSTTFTYGTDAWCGVMCLAPIPAVVVGVALVKRRRRQGPPDPDNVPPGEKDS